MGCDFGAIIVDVVGERLHPETNDIDINGVVDDIK